MTQEPRYDGDVPQEDRVGTEARFGCPSARKQFRRPGGTPRTYSALFSTVHEMAHEESRSEGHSWPFRPARLAASR